ncbi:MAG: hypothetical protein UT11_C0020G0002 [Berkelbacteria bacterium GW2011_GWA2_38_9]|uniref:Uncharacterized protein n=1 Tax=Berkelbacteria bacterium GW2011_GWA2_38_9 TaxID=1618334 RepID=A0A0G0NV05_9BACT|nr:MAG: hypothetical protein UT11_C0020G0002 [Berkelbacteria bacterium GW2011_GWA2_38_9]
MSIYKTKVKRISGYDYHDVMSKALKIYHEIKKRSKRKPYIRSAYFNKDKIFLDYFWGHLNQKIWIERLRRLKFYPCALDLLKHNRTEPILKKELKKDNAILYRFIGETPDGSKFYVQIKENLSKKQKYLISIFPDN